MNPSPWRRPRCFWWLSSLLVLSAAYGVSASEGGGLSLGSIPPPDPARVEPLVFQELAGAYRRVEELRAAESVESGDLAQVIGHLGQLYAAYNFRQAAIACFENARVLAPEDPRWPYYLGYLYQLEGELAAAERSLEGAAELAPGDFATLLRLGEVRLNLHRLEAAAEAFQQALAMDPRSAAAHFGLGRIAALRDEPATAARHLEEALSLQPQATQIHYPLGLAYRRLGDLERARQHLARRGDGRVTFPDPRIEELSRLASGSALHLLRGDRAMTEGRVADAVAEYRQAVAQSPGHYHYRKALAIALYNLGDLDGAQRELEGLLELDPDGPKEQVQAERAWVHYTLGTLQVNQGRDDEALAEFRAALELVPEYAEAHLEAANVLGRAGRLEEAIQQLSRLLRFQPDHRVALTKRATALMDLERYGEALPDLRRGVELAPEEPLAHLRLAAARRQLGMAAEARAGYEKALELGLFPRGARLFAHLELATLLQEEGRLEEALAHHQEARRLDPRHPRGLRGLAETLIRLGRWAEAREELERGLEVRRDDPFLTLVLARLLAAAPDPALRDGARALDLAQGLAESEPTPEHLATVALAHGEQGDFQEAAEWLGRALEAAGREGRTELATRLRAILDSFEAGQPWRPRSPEEMLP